VFARIVVGDPQSKRIRLSACARGGCGRQILRRGGQCDLPFLHTAAVNRELHGKLILPRDRARGGGQGRLEHVSAVDGLGHGSLPHLV